MKGNQAVIGLDIGTTSTKAVLFGPQGKVISKHSVPYDLIHPSQHGLSRTLNIF